MKKNIILSLLAMITSIKSFSQLPTFTWAKANFGYIDDNVNEVAIDNEGNVIEVGFFKSATNLTSGLGAFNLQGTILEQSPYPSSCTNCPYGDSYIAKYDNSGNLLWNLRTTGDYSENITSVTTDNQNNIYVCGTYLSVNLTIGNTTTIDSNPYQKGFIAKISPMGVVQWLQKNLATLGSYPSNSSVGAQLVNLKTDTLGNVYALGQMRSSSISCGALNLDLLVANNQYRQDCFIIKYDTNGVPQWLKGIQGTDIEDVTKIDVDTTGNVYFSGTTFSPNLLVAGTSHPTGNSINGTMNSSFTGKIDTNGNIVWLDFSDFGDIGLFFFNETTVDSQGNVYTIGHTKIGLSEIEPVTITFGSSSVTIPYIPNVRRDNVLVVCKYSTNGEKLWMKTSPYNMYIRGNGIDIDENDNIYILGQYLVPTDFGPYTLPNADFISYSISTSNPEYKTFIASLNTNGDVNWARQTGQHIRLETSDIEVDNNGSIVLGGKFVQGSSINFDGSILSGYINSSTFRDAYIAKFNTIIPETTAFITGLSRPYGLTIDNTNNLFFTEVGLSNGNKISQAVLGSGLPTVTTSFANNLNKPTRIKYYDNYLYVTESDSNEISRANLSLPSPVMQTYFNTELVAPMGLDVVVNKLFVGDFGSNSIKNIDTSVIPFQVNIHVNDFANDLVNDGILMYFVNDTSSNVYATNILDSDAPLIVIAEGITKPSSLLLHDNVLYISDSTEGSIYRINPYGGSTTPQLLITGLNEPNGMVVYNNDLYIAETGANRIITFNLSTLTIDDNTSENLLFTISPNPTTDFINFKTNVEIDTLEIYSVSGNLLFKENRLNENSLSLSHLSSGIYFVKAYSLNKSETKKVIKL